MSPATDLRVDWRLCAMMLLQYAAMGVWLPILPSYLKADISSGGLGFSGFEIGWIIAIAPALGSMTAPFLAGQAADRYFPTERYLAGAFLASGLILWVLAAQTSFVAWALLTLLFAVSFFPTLGLATALALAHLSDTRTQFPRVRVWGTFGWIAVAWGFPVLFLQETVSVQLVPPFVGGPDRADATARIANALRVSAGISLVAACFCVFLPHTPPARHAVTRFAFVSVLRLSRYRSIAVLIVVSLGLAAIDRMYFIQAAPFLESIGLRTSQVMPAMALGQLAEIVAMTLLGPMLVRFGFRWVLALGACCYFLRFVIFAAPGLPLPVIVASQALHGVCFACSFVTAVIYIDRLIPPDARRSAQGGFSLVAMGSGAIAGGLLNGFFEQQFTFGGQLDYSRFWCSCAAVGLAGAVGILVLFRDESRDATEDKVTR